MQRSSLLVFAEMSLGAFLILPLAAVLMAQTRFAALAGDVSDASGGMIAGAAVKIRNAGTDWQVSVKTDEGGRYFADNIPPGTYELTASGLGMRPLVVEDQPLFVGTTSTRNFRLEVGTVSEQVTASATAAMIDSTKSELGQIIARSEIDDLPVLGRGYATLMALTPNVQFDNQGGGFSVGGQRGFANNFIIDGFTNRNLNGGGQVIAYSQDWIEEFKVSTNGYAAEFGGASGGIVNVITRSGSNQLHARGYSFFQKDKLNATPPFTTLKPKVALYRPGGYVSGPLRRDKIFFFGGYEYLHNAGAAIVTAPLEVCAPPATKDPVSRTCAVPNGNDLLLYLVKADWTIGPKYILNQRLTRQHNTDFNSGVGGPNTVEYGRFSDNRYWGYSANWTTVLDPHTTNEIRGGINRAYPWGGVNAGNTYAIIYPSSNLGAPVNHGVIALDWIQFLDNLSVIRGKHNFKFGGDFNNVRLYSDFRNIRDGIYTMRSDKPFNLADATTYPLFFQIVLGTNTADFRSNNGGLFAQDSWRILPNLTLNYGLRWDSDNSVGIAGTNRINNVSPRFGLAWGIGRSNKTVFRIAGGLFSDAEHTNIAGIFVANTLTATKSIFLGPNAGPLFNPFFDPANPTASMQKLALFLAQAFAAKTIPDLNALPSSVSGTNGIDKDFRTPYTGQVTAGVTRLLTSELSTSVDVVYHRAVNLLVARDVNLSRQGTRIDPNFGSQGNFGGLGDGSYRSVSARLDYRSRRLTGGLAYTYAKCDDNTSALLTGGGVTTPYDINADRGPCDNDIRNSLVSRGSGRLPLGIMLSSIYIFRGAPPYSEIKPPVPIFTRFAPRNNLRGSTFSSWDARVSRPIRVTERWTANFLVEAYNLLNKINYAGYIGNRDSVQFGKPTGASARRQMQMGVRVDF